MKTAIIILAILWTIGFVWHWIMFRGIAEWSEAIENRLETYRKENDRKIIERIKELDSKGYCHDKNEPCPYMDDSERGCATCIAEKVADEMKL